MSGHVRAVSVAVVAGLVSAGVAAAIRARWLSHRAGRPCDRWLQPMSLQEVAAEFGVSPERVREIETQVLRRLEELSGPPDRS